MLSLRPQGYVAIAFTRDGVYVSVYMSVYIPVAGLLACADNGACASLTFLLKRVESMKIVQYATAMAEGLFLGVLTLLHKISNVRRAWSSYVQNWPPMALHHTLISSKAVR